MTNASEKYSITFRDLNQVRMQCFTHNKIVATTVASQLSIQFGWSIVEGPDTRVEYNYGFVGPEIPYAYLKEDYVTGGGDRVAKGTRVVIRATRHLPDDEEKLALVLVTEELQFQIPFRLLSSEEVK